jgi:2-methylisocitrate lyase-like PEP mutase family enzyme
VYLAEVGDPACRYEETLRRLGAFRAAGADCVFVPGLKDAPVIGQLVADLKCPVNILAGPGSPSVAELRKLGVARISLGSGPMRAALGHFRRTMEELKTQGTYTSLDDAVPYADLNRMLS